MLLSLFFFWDVTVWGDDGRFPDSSGEKPWRSLNSKEEIEKSGEEVFMEGCLMERGK